MITQLAWTVSHPPHYGHPPSLRWSTTIPRTVTHHPKDDYPTSPGRSPTITWTITHHPISHHLKDSHLPPLGWSPTKGSFPSKVIFIGRSSCMEGCLPSKVVFHRRSSSIKGRLPSKVVFHQRQSSIKGRLPSRHISSCHNNPSSRSESSNYKLGRLDKKKLGQTDKHPP